MSNAGARHPTRTTRGADLGLASQIHFFIPSLKLDNKGKALGLQTWVSPAMPHRFLSAAVAHRSHLSPLTASFVCTLFHKHSQEPPSKAASLAGPSRMDSDAKIRWFLCASWKCVLAEKLQVWKAVRVPRDFRKSCSPLNWSLPPYWFEQTMAQKGETA